MNKFNITKQSKDYDLDGDYIRHWIPELKDVPAPRIHEPWLMSKAEQVRQPSPLAAHPVQAGASCSGRSDI